MDKLKLRGLEILSIASVILVIIIIRGYYARENNRLYDDLDLARKEYYLEIVDYDPYEKGLDKYVKSVKVIDWFDDEEYSNTYFYTNHDKVTVYMTDGFDWLTVEERCGECAQLMDEIRPEMNRHFKESRFYKLYTENQDGSYMKYRGKLLDLSYECGFEFRTSAYVYTFPLYGNMTVTGLKTGSVQYYEYGFMDGKLWRFEDKNKAGKAEEKKSSEKKASEKKPDSTGSSSSGTYKKSTKSTYDPYDAHKYKSAQDFADDKYEEFYDYEDDYEDEDEAYDAAEDYWYDYND